jgi:hypothetical protein
VTSLEEFQRLYSDAIALVSRDADAILGKGVVTHVVDPDEEAFLREIGPDVERPPGHLIILGHSGGGFSWHSDMTWPDYVVSAAEGIQEALFEGDDFWGIAFPPCSIHPNHPLNPESCGWKGVLDVSARECRVNRHWPSSGLGRLDK